MGRGGDGQAGVKRIRRAEDLTPDARNANRGTPRGRELLGDSLRQYGAGRSIVVDRAGRILAGNKTLAQARALDLPVETVQTEGERLVVVQRVDLDLDTDVRARQLALADNRIAELDLDWDDDVLRDLLEEGVSVEGLWSDDELAALLGVPAEAEEHAVVAPRATTIRRRDLFALGAHRLLCGDATRPEEVARVLDGEVPPLLTTDPPYGVAYDPAWRHRVDPTQRTAVGRVAHDDRVDWADAYRLFPGAVAYVWHAGLSSGPVAAALQQAGFDLRAQILWVKQHFVLSRGDYHWQHEPCWYAVRRGASAGWQGDRTQTTVWSVPNLNAMGGTRTDDNAVTGHGTQKPVRLFEMPIRNHTTRGAWVFDPFVGSGTAIIAAEKTQRRSVAMEIDPVYVQAAIDRWERFTGRQATKRGDGVGHGWTP